MNEARRWMWCVAVVCTVAGWSALGCGESKKNSDNSAGAVGTSDSTDGTSTSASGGAATTGAGGVSGEPSEADLLEAAVLLGSCYTDDGINRHLARFRTPERFGLGVMTPETVACLVSTGGGCDAVGDCLSLTAEVAPEPCETTCEGSVINYCGDGVFSTLDCAAYGLPCNETTVCGEDGGTCDEEGDQICVGSVVYDCQDGVLFEGPDCGLSGLVCQDGECVGSGDNCSEPNDTYQDGFDYGGMSCDGGTLVACVGGAVERVDCTRLGAGYSCQTFEDAYFCGLGSECSPGELDIGTSGTPETCDGTSVVFCDEGRVESVDCTSLGFTGCEEQNYDARCTPNSLTPF